MSSVDYFLLFNGCFVLPGIGAILLDEGIMMGSLGVVAVQGLPLICSVHGTIARDSGGGAIRMNLAFVPDCLGVWTIGLATGGWTPARAFGLIPGHVAPLVMSAHLVELVRSRLVEFV